MPDRVPCINPRCRRTAAQEKYPDSDDIICGKCWRQLPVSMRRRDRQLRKRWKLVDRMAEKGTGFRRRGRRHGRPDLGVPQAYTMRTSLGRLWDQHWERLRAFFATPDKPAGLDTFLEEMNL
ncbi:MAG: hypothetical protein EOS72_03335 [Mesorhizobium sp.]|uniref:hypothetical protein n=1 Tax=Mesorhizobium sp. TaxID=1871066 RepID=UPI000FE82A51|nr:hypothetical protein [Mesorhizobium sp.]RWC91702.1 MAG: hypothetical protein EOS72_03335 [Mesorhizobium sp.]